MPRKKQDGTTPESSKCSFCWKQPGVDIIQHQNRRHAHFLSFPHGDALKAHLLEQYGSDGEKDGSIQSILNWYYTVSPERNKKPSEMAIDGRDFTDGPEPVWKD